MSVAWWLCRDSGQRELNRSAPIYDSLKTRPICTLIYKEYKGSRRVQTDGILFRRPWSDSCYKAQENSGRASNLQVKSVSQEQVCDVRGIIYLEWLDTPEKPVWQRYGVPFTRLDRVLKYDMAAKSRKWKRRRVV